MNTIIIDCNNLIHKIPGFKKIFSENPESAQLSLIESVKSKVKTKSKIIFVFDGFGKLLKKDVVYSGKLSADDVIKKYIEENYQKNNLTLISSDNEITRLAKVCSCDVKRSEDFWSELNSINYKEKSINQLLYKEGEKPDRISKKELDEFMKYFT